MELDFNKCTNDQLRALIENGNTPAICAEAWKKYKANGGEDWKYFAKYGGWW